MPNDSMLPGPFDYVNQYHAETISTGRAKQLSDGKVVTVNAIGVEHEGKIYTVPGYDRNTGKLLSPEEAKSKHMNAILEGKVAGIPLKFDGPASKHPANVLAKQNHRKMESPREQARAIDAVYWK